ncbi:SURF1 family protein [Rhodococcus fascians]|uniref:SURF1 family cytochrome oxidase biogenesis protein n=1 Tax=Rhodococcoides fascians TaxID=1828 RepID=UPI00050BEED9|nr:SURF1 family protein [Rhodococcus fascians]MDP9639353.1 cytochrome oxidase assembly protein ShyY1 [Rhodococcus cercidiphylli]RZL70170.1 MAG: SURF1 family protein [Rhodococcus sp. (in: high G+C Gram-positive bacteria)]MBM7242309.1 SURF1 family protein [Rhodococcus fascians]MBY3809534.1 SURF1 family protein [Rhodococcus fascians]MBY3840457.1 SURF1 family protein [Rhodococcus fascians]
MEKLRFLLRPKWLVLAAVALAFAFLCFSVLAPWQLGKNTSTSARNDLITRSVGADPVPITDVLTGNGFAADDEWRRVIAQGSYVENSDALVRLRSIREQPAYEVITPFVIDGGPTVLVNRGYVLPVEGTRPPEFAAAPTGPVTLDARVRQAEGTSREPIQEDGRLQVYNINPEQIGAAVGVDAIDGYLQLDDGQPGGLGLIELPQTDAGPYLSYGLQWLAFGIMAPLGLAYFVRAELRERRMSRTEMADAMSDESDPTSDDDSASDDEEEFTLPTRREKRARARAASQARTPTDPRLADRYGKNR